MILRKKARLIITLFMMMMNTGIPEVKNLEDIEYIKNTLVPHLSDEEAKRHFKRQFDIALKNSWKAMFNNMFHNVAKNNT